MIEDKFFFDLETLPTLDEALIAEISASITPPGSMKKAGTIEKWMLEERPGAIEEAVRKTSLDGGLGRLASICWAKADGEILGAHTAGPAGWDIEIEKALISGFFAEADSFYEAVAGAVLTGHNVLGFDIRWLWKRAIVLGITVPHWWPLSARPWSPEVFDTMTAWEGAGSGKFISQDRLGRILGLGGKSDIDGSMVADLWDAGRYDDVLSYNGDDVSKCRRMWARITQHDGPIEPEISAPAQVAEKPVEATVGKKSKVSDQIISRARVVAHGEVMTAEREVNAMLDLVDDETRRIESRFLEPACGTGNFLVEILRRKLAVVEKAHVETRCEFERSVFVAVSSIYGIDIQTDNVERSRERLFLLVDETYERLFPDADKSAFMRCIGVVLDKNIVWGDFLKMATPGADPRPIDFIEWSSQEQALAMSGETKIVPAAEKSGKFFADDDEELAEEVAPVETLVAAPVEEKPKRGRVVPKFLRERGLAA